MLESSLLSVIVLCYNNQKHLYENLDSIFAQNYPNIELIVSDDGSKSFDIDAVREYIGQNITKNISNVVINVNAKNVGTVKHLELMLERSAGSYVTTIAADDVYSSQTVLTSLMNEFNVDDSRQVITSRIGMYDESLDILQEVFTSEADIDLINSGDSQKLYEALCSRCFIAAAGTIYKRIVFDKLGKLSEHYFIVEDWTSQLRMARLGVVIRCLDLITVKHRHGGISHGNRRNANASYLKYCLDFITAFKLEIYPYINNIKPSARAKIIEIGTWHYNNYKRMVNEQALAQRFHISVETLNKLRHFKNLLLDFSSSLRVYHDLHYAAYFICIGVVLCLGGYLFPNTYGILIKLSHFVVLFGLFFALLSSLRIIIHLVLSFWIFIRYKHIIS